MGFGELENTSTGNETGGLMNRMVDCVIIILAMVSTLNGYGWASDLEMRCGTRLVSVGMHQGEVQALCGEPTSSRSWQEGGWQSGTVTIEEWSYNFGPERFQQFLKFKNGVLNSIESGSYGY
jgi:hypothetical protein